MEQLNPNPIEESIACPYCDGHGRTMEYITPTLQIPDEESVDGLVEVPCFYCCSIGRITTQMLKEHIKAKDRLAEQANDLPF